MECGASTTSGSLCKRRVKVQGERCWCHKESSDPQNTCSVCLSELTGPCKKLPCQHEFHRKCINQWKDRGNNTCPYCRYVFAEEVPRYKVTITVENTRAQSSRVFHPINIPRLVQDFLAPDAQLTEIFIDVDDEESLSLLMNDLGVSEFQVNS